MRYTKPEKKGIPTEALKKYIEHLEYHGLNTHSLIVARGNDIVLEKYWEPFNRDFLHRMYSVTKSFVAIAIGFLADEGRVSLADPISKYFPTEAALAKDDYIRDQTVRDMLMMCSAMPSGYPNWFRTSPEDRVLDYFTNNKGAQYPSGTVFSYDSTGSFVVGSLVERVTGMTLCDYLDEKLFSHLGIEGAYMLKCPGGHSWSDSALLMRPIDLLKCARFMLDGGRWEGKQFLSESFVREATAKLVSTEMLGRTDVDGEGYGYLIWRARNNSFFFNGMGCQLAIANFDKDVIFVYNGDNQGNAIAKSYIIDGFFEIVYPEIADCELPEYKGDPIGEYKLAVARGNKSSKIADAVNGKKYTFRQNPMGIEEMRVSFEGIEGRFDYKNKSGEKTLFFAFGENRFGKFPEDGYSDLVGSKRAPGNKYDSAVSGAWVGDHELLLNVQIIDKYFGNLIIRLSFKGDEVAVSMGKCAEDFLDEYSGIAHGKAVAD
jgi:CubicO group peptidase (beta-lactamase class C family)